MADGTKVSIDTLALDARPAPAPREPERGALVGRYIVLGRLGAGGMGVVYAAYNPDLDRKVALKLVRAAAHRDASHAFARLLREAQAMARFTHPNIVTVHDVGLVDDQLFIAMELVEGATLRGWLAAAPRGWREIVAAFRQAGAALAAAHARGIVHRDFKPENVLVDGEGRVRVADFGLARSAASADSVDGPASGEDAPAPASPALTQPGAIVGTPAYMAPEQRRGLVDARADQYSFGVALREALGAAAPPWLARIVARCVRERPEERWPAMADVVAALGRDPALRRRRLIAIAAPVVAVAAAWFASSALRDEGRVCRAAAARAAEPWSPARRQAVRAAFTASGAANAAATIDRVEATLDRYRDALGAMAGESCRTTRFTGGQSPELGDLRAACLDERRASLAALASVLAAPDQKVVNRAVDAALSLPPVADCADVVRLRDPKPLPRDPRARARLGVLRATLAEARAMSAIGRPALVVDRVRAVATEAAALGHRPTEALALMTVGDLTQQLQSWPQSVAALEGAVLAGDAGNDRDVSQGAATLLVLVLGRLHRADEAHAWGERARALIEGLGNDPWKLASLENNLATIAWTGEKFADALAGYERAIALRTRAPGWPRIPVAMNLSNMGLVYWSLGQQETAVAYHRRAIQLTEEALGPDHPQVASFLGNLGASLLNLGRYDEARPVYRRALAIFEATSGPDSPTLGTPLNGMASILEHDGKLEESLAMHRRALAIFEKAFGPDARKVGVSLGYTGNILRQLGRYDEARPLLERALAIHRKLVGEDHEDVAEALAQLAELDLNAKHWEAALAGFDRARAIWEKIGDLPSVATALAGIAETHFDRGDYRAALAPLERAVTVRQSLADNPLPLAEDRFLLARVLWLTGGDRGRARALAESAKPGLPKAERDTVEAWLAEHRGP